MVGPAVAGSQRNPRSGQQPRRLGCAGRCDRRARLYHVITDYEIYTHHPLRAFAIWDGGLGIPGGIAAGSSPARRRPPSSPSPPPTPRRRRPRTPLAQAIGRWGNWFNQELFGRPSTLPWAIRIDPSRRPAGFAAFTTFQPTFLYESLWNLAVVATVLFAERRHRLRPGRLFAVYIAGYATGRFIVERMRIDYAHTIAGLRVNEWTSIFAFLIATTVLASGRIDHTHHEPEHDDIEGPQSERHRRAAH